MNVAPPLPSWKRYSSLFYNKKGFSVLRELQYEIIKDMSLKGNVLDFGGGEKADYRNILRCESYESVNIDPEMNPTYLSKVDFPVPCPRNHYDTVISFNTIEHVFEAKKVLRDMFDSLKVGGEIACATPFLYPVHAHPDDFFRPTGSWWRESLLKVGFKDVETYPLLWGPFSTAAVCGGLPGPLRSIRVHMALMVDVAYTRFRCRNEQETFSGRVGENLQNYALGYFVRAKK